MLLGYYWGTAGTLQGFCWGTIVVLPGYYMGSIGVLLDSIGVLLDKHRNTSGVLLWYYWGRGGLSKLLLGYC